MKNGYTPKQFAYMIAVDHLYFVHTQKDGWLDIAIDMTDLDKKKVREQMAKLHKKLANAVKLDTNELI